MTTNIGWTANSRLALSHLPSSRCTPLAWSTLRGSLPLAFVYCSTLGAALIQGYTRPDGTRDTLSLKDLDKCLNLAPQLAQANLDTLISPLIDSWQLGPKCERDHECISYANRYSSGRTGPFGQVLSIARKEIFPSLETYGFDSNAVHDMCIPCWEYIKTRYQTQQKRWWKALPEMAGLVGED